MATKAQPVTAGSKLLDPKSATGLTQGGVQHFNQWQQSINSIPIAVTGEEVAGAGMKWTLANTPAANVMLLGVTADGVLPLVKGAGNLWNYTIDGAEITTVQNFESVIASYQYQQ
jgi:hypothetical protein